MWSPPNPIKNFYYECGKSFMLSNLIKLYEMLDDYAIVLVSGKRSDFYLYNQNNTKFVKSIEESLPNQHKTGGQSAQRFERIRDEMIGWYVKKITENMKNIYVKEGVTKIKGLIVAGPSHMKDQLLKDEIFLQFFNKKLLKILTIGEITNESINQVITMSLDVTTTHNQLLLEFERMLSDPQQMDLIVFGNEFVNSLFESGNLKEIYIGSTDFKIRKKYLNAGKKTKIIFIDSVEFNKKYGGIVGIKYYMHEDNESINMHDTNIVEI